MMANGDSKYPDWMHDEMPDALDTISDINLCKYMGWTFDQLDEQYNRHPDKVTVLAITSMPRATLPGFAGRRLRRPASSAGAAPGERAGGGDDEAVVVETVEGAAQPLRER